MKYVEFPLRKTVNEERLYEEMLSSSEFSRLLENVYSVDTPIHFKIQGGTNALGQKELKGFVKLTLSQICQRCLEPFQTELDLPIHWIPVRDESEEELIGDEDAVLMIDQSEVNLLELLEDEILLSLPLVPKHAHDQYCEGQEYLDELKPQEETKQPFVELAKLLKK